MMELSRFEKKCLSLSIGYDHDVCDGKYCEWKLTCLRYMLYKKAKLQGYNMEFLYHIQQKFDFKNCYLKYGQENKQENR